MNKLLTIFGNYFYPAAFVISCCFIYSCENTPDQIREWTTNKQMVEEVTNIESYLSQEGKIKAKLQAPLMYRVMAADTLYAEFPNSLHVDFFNDSTQIQSWLDSRYGKYFENLNKVYLRDSVVVISKKGDTLRCHDLWWDQNKALFYTDKVATYHSPGNNITGGKGMEASQDFSNVTFKYPLGIVKIAANGFAE